MCKEPISVFNFALSGKLTTGIAVFPTGNTSVLIFPAKSFFCTINRPFSIPINWFSTGINAVYFKSADSIFVESCSKNYGFSIFTSLKISKTQSIA